MNADDPQPKPADDLATIAMPGNQSRAPDRCGAHGRRFGEYELLEEIARGGMGVVYKARQAALNRVVALKMILSGQLARDEDVKRFHTEAESAAGLDHPGIVPVYEVGQHEGQHFFSMGFVEGESLAKKIAAGPLPSREAAELVAAVADAVQYAHEKGIIHRDLKPANILLDHDGRPRVTDFGLARRMEGDSHLTGTGQVLGTPSFMPPEQAAGNVEQIGPAADIYALGAVLYTLVTGRPPFQAATPVETLLQVLESQPAAPRLVNSQVDEDLQTICLKCLEKEPRHRYASARDVAADLRRYVEGEPISVKSLNLVDRMTRALQRSKYDAELRTWSTMLVQIALIVFLAEVGIYFHARRGPPYPQQWAISLRAAQFILMGLVFWWNRRGAGVSNQAAERQMWAILIAYVVACNLAVVSVYQMASAEYPLDQLRVYPAFAVLSGFALFVMGSNYWGQCYALGAAFFILALVMPYNLKLAPLEFGALWAACLLLIAWHLRRIARPAAQPKTLHDSHNLKETRT